MFVTFPRPIGMLQVKRLTLMIGAIILQTAAHSDDLMSSDTNSAVQQLNVIKVVASADASANGLMPSYAGGQVAVGGKVGLFGNQKNIDTPFNLTSYTNEYIQEHNARSVGDVLQGDPSVRLARGFGNFQESYFIRGFILGSDDTAYNGLYGILPRQYIPSQLFERVEVLKGASAFLNGSTPGNGGVGGAINLLPKRAKNEPMTRLTVGSDFNSGEVSADISRRFGTEKQFGIRVNTAFRDGNTSIDNEKASLGLFAVGLDYHNDRLRLSGDMGYSNNRLKATRPNVTLGSTVTSVPYAPKASSNFAQKWSYSNEEDIFGSYRAEYDLSDRITAYAAYGFRHGEEHNSIANLTLSNASTGAGTFYRFDNSRKDDINTGELGIKMKAFTGSVEHDLVLSGSAFQQDTKNAYVMDYFNNIRNNLYQPTQSDQPTILANAFKGNTLDNPKLTARNRLQSLALGDNLKAFDEKLIVMLGGRYQKMVADSYTYNTSVNTRYSKGKFTPAVGLTYKLTPEIAVYGNYIEALTAGGTAPSTAIQSLGKQLSPYVSKQKEVGIKFDNQLFGLTADFFSTEKQRGIVNNSLYYVADGKDRHNGIELTTYGKVSDGVKLLGGATWLDAKQKETTSGSYDGKRVIGVPKFQANLETTWQLPIPNDISVNGRIVYTGASYADNANKLKVPSWTRFDLGAIYKTHISNIPTKFNFTVNNVFNKDYWASVGGYENYGYLNAGAPRTFMLSASFDF